MKKLKLFIAALALLVGGGTASAQKDVTSQYIKNATLSSLDGWTNVNFNNPQRGNNTVGYATECYEGWNALEKSNYSLTQKITLPAGNYTLVNYSFFREGESFNTDPSVSRAFLKASDKEVAVKTLGSIQAAGYANSQAEGANAFDSKMYRNTLDFTIDADNTEIEIGVYGTFNTSILRSWMILGMFELIDNDQLATMDSPFDVTGYMTNPGFEYRDLTGWTQEPAGYFQTQNNNQGFKVGGYYAEKWQQTGALPEGKMSQTLTDLPAGYYKLTVNLGGNGTYVDLNGKTASWTADKDYTVGYVLAENEDLTITAGKTAEGTANWIHFDNFRLQFCGDVAAALTTLCESVTSYEGTIPTAAYTALKNNVDSYNKTYTDVDELLAAIDAVQALYDEADKLKAPYATFKALIAEGTPLIAGYSNLQSGLALIGPMIEAATDAATIEGYNNTLQQALAVFKQWIAIKAVADQIIPVANDNAEANATLKDTRDEQEEAVQGAQLTSLETVVPAAITALKEACTNYVFTVNPVGEDAKFDCTFLMTNPDLTGLPTWARCDGWTSEYTDGNYQVMVNDSKTVTVDGKTYDYFYEYWSNPAKDGGVFALYNAVTLPAGTFEMSCFAFAEDQYTSTKNSQVFFYANDTQGSKVDAAVLTQQSISFNNAAEGEVKIGLKTLTGNTYNWMGIGYVELYKVPAATTAYAITVNATNVTVKVMQGDEEITESLPLETITLNVTPDEGYVVSEVTADADGATIDVANLSDGVYTFQMPKADVEVTVTAQVNKLPLTNEINYATEFNVKVQANKGDAAFQVATADADALTAAIDAAQAVLDNADATPTEVKKAVSDLQAAQEIELNAPAEGQLFNVILTYSGWTYDNMAMTYIANAREDAGNYNIQYAAEANKNLAQAFTFTKVEGNAYTMSQIDADGNVRYISTGAIYEGGNASQIRTTTNADEALVIVIAVTATEGVWNLINTEIQDNNAFIGSQDAGVYTVNSHIDFKLVETNKPEVSINTAEAGWGTVVLPFKADVPAGVTVYSCAAAEGTTLTLVEVEAIEANKPYIIEGAWEDDLTGDAQGTKLVNTEGWLSGVYADQAAPAGSYVMQQLDGQVGFYKVGETAPTVGANHAYLTVPAAAAEGARAFYLDDQTTTAISAIEALTSGNAQIFNANGAQLPRLQKGVNIVRQADGKSFKVVVK